MNKKYLLVFLLIALYACSHETATIKEGFETFVTYPFSDPDAIPRPDRDYYPYFRFDGFTNDPDSVDWKVVVMENKYVEVHIFPELGGKVWGAIEKSTGNEFIYYNSVVKFRDIGMRGPWTSGGIELNFGPIAHTPAHSGPVDYIIKSNEDGSVSCFVGTIDLITRARWEVEVNLQPDKAYFTTNSAYHNPTAILQPYWTWSTAAYKADGNPEFIFPGDHWVGHGGDLHTWPVDEKGRDLSMYNNNDFGSHKSYHVVGGIGDFFAGYWHDLNFGAGHHSVYGDKQGKKIWIWSLSRSGGIWEDLLTDNDGQYVELQSGRRLNQAQGTSTQTPFKHLGFMPYGTDTFKEYWYPVLNTRGVAKANSIGALNVVKEGGEQIVYLSPLQSINDDVNIYFGDELKYSFNINLKTLEVWKETISNNSQDEPLKVIVGNNKLVYSEEKGYNLSSRPLESPSEFDWNSVYGLYVDGLNWVYQGRFDRAIQSFSACLEKDPLYAPALNRMAELHYRKADFGSALALTRKSLSINTYDPEANYLFGLANMKLDNLVNAQDGFSVASISPSYRTAAYIELAKLFIIKNELHMAEQFTGRILDMDSFNQEAILLAAFIARITGDPEKAEKHIALLEELSPLNHFARFEKMLFKGDRKSKENFVSMIRNELPHETFMEMSLWYEYIGFSDEAIKLLEMSPGNSLVFLRLAFLNRNKNFQESENYFKKAISQTPDFIFPYRFETVPALEWASSKTDNWKPKYYLGLLHWSLGNKYSAEDLFSQCSQLPGSPYFYLAKADLFKDKDDYDAENDLLKARNLGSNDWRTYISLIDYYLEENNPEEALNFAEESFAMFPANDVVQYNYAKCLLANGYYSESLNILENAVIMPFEGARFGRITYWQAAVMESLHFFGENDFDQAMKSINKARLWPENLGVGRPYTVDERIEDFLEAKLLLILNEEGKALDLYNDIVAFTENKHRRFSSADFLHLIALKRLGRNEEAENFIAQWHQNSPDDPVLRWTRAMMDNNRAAAELIAQDIITETGGSPWDSKNADSEFVLVRAISEHLNFSHISRVRLGI